MPYLKDLRIKKKKLQFPIYFPDATRAVVRSIDSSDLERAKVEGLVVNTYHLMTQPGTSVIKEMGGVKQYMSWNHWIVSDSGGFQIMSLLRKNSALGSVTDKGIVIHQGVKNRKKYLFTPEKSIQVQFALGADIMICLDDFTPPKASPEETEITVNRTVDWAKRCKAEFLKQLDRQGLSQSERPLLFGVIQGGSDKEARSKCATELLEIGFDGFGFGGWPITDKGQLDYEITHFVSTLVPQDSLLFALGVGSPENIVRCFQMGYHFFDCVLPTRDARHRRLYVFSQDPEKVSVLEQEKVHSYVYILREKYTRDQRPISEFCDCYSCQNYSRAYLNHLFRIEDSLAWRLATIHNLRMYTKLIELLRKSARKTTT